MDALGDSCGDLIRGTLDCSYPVRAALGQDAV